MAVLLVLAAVRSGMAGPADWAAVARSGVVATIYALGARWTAVSTSAVEARVWLAVLLAAWVALLVLTPDAIYLAFPWFFLLLYLLPRRVGLTAVLFTTAAAVAGFGWHQDKFAVAMVIGPALGAAAAIATVFGYQTLQEESEQRRRLIIELDRTRADLARAQHQSGVLDERERLAREIHDTLAQGLTSIQLLLAAAQRSLTAAQTAEQLKAAELVEQARLMAQENLAEARRFVHALAPGDLQQSTLPAALQRLCSTTTTRTGIPVTFHEVGHVPTLPTPVEVALLRIAQAALGNVTQHAKPTRADITLTGMDTAVTLDVVDDGTGFDTDTQLPMRPAGPGQGGFGLRSMRSRADDLGGVLSVESHPGRGTAVSVHFERPPQRSTADHPRAITRLVR
ncbi:sensor histidine kinase [Pedococcus soli]